MKKYIKNLKFLALYALSHVAKNFATYPYSSMHPFRYSFNLKVYSAVILEFRAWLDLDFANYR